MSKTRRILSGLLAIVLIATIFIGCNGGTGSSGSSATESSAASSAADSSEPASTDDGGEESSEAPAPSGDFKEVTLKFTTIGNSQPDTARISQAASDYLKSIGKPYSVEINIVEWSAYNDVVNLMLNSGEKFDVVFTANWAASYYANVPNGVFAPLNDYLAANPEIEEILTADFMNAAQVNGVNYALPTNKEKARQVGMLFRKDIVDAMGMDITTVKTKEDMEQWMVKAKEEHGLWTWPNFIPMDRQPDILEERLLSLSYDGSGTVVATDLTPEFKESLVLLNKWYNMGLISPNLTRDTVAQQELASGSTFGLGSQLKPGKDTEESASVGYELVQVPLNEPEIANTETTGAMLAIPVASDNKDEAFDFIKLLYTDKEFVNIFVWGQEGTDYTKVDDNTVEIIGDSGWDWGQGWTLGNQFNDYLTTAEDPQKWEKFEEFNEQGKPLMALGFMPDSSSTEIQTYISTLKATRDNFLDLLSFGYVDDIDGELARLEAQYNAAGMQELITEYQRQFDEWQASKG
ncbi:MAG: ABC transporter substrate-binding protein [Oscillospiraceae bacterium]